MPIFPPGWITMGTGAETTSERISKIIPGFLLHIVLYERLLSHYFMEYDVYYPWDIPRAS